MPTRTQPVDVRSLGQEAIPTVITALMRDVGIPSGLRALGYSEDDVPELVAGTIKQTLLLIPWRSRATRQRRTQPAEADLFDSGSEPTELDPDG